MTETTQTLRQITKDFLEFWVWQPVIDKIEIFDEEGETIGFENDFSHYDFRGKWVIAMRDESDADSFFLPDIDFYRGLREIGDCFAVGIPRPRVPDSSKADA